LYGPGIVRIRSDKAAELVLGRVRARADTVRGHGFTLFTRTASVVDLGTEFDLQAAADGHSAVYVSSGAVEIRAGKSTMARRLVAGQSAEIEPGSAGVVTIIEGGDNTAAFKFPTIEPPSNRDYADASQHHATIRVVEGKLHVGSGPASILVDGRGQSRPDVCNESAVFDDVGRGKLLMDLGRNVAVQKINTYSWHVFDEAQRFAHTYHPKAEDPGAERRSCRAPQRYTLYGFLGDQPPPTTGDPAAHGWKMICRVNTDEFFSVPPAENRPPQQAVSIQGSGGTVGRYRYLLWHVFPTHVEHEYFGNPGDEATFFGEFDVYAEQQRTEQ